MFKKLLSSQPWSVDTGILIVRVAAAVLMLQYGWEKLSNYTAWSKDFPDPLHVTHPVSLALVVFAEFFCSLFIGLGLLTRFALVPLIVNMIIIIVIVHAKDPFSVKEHAVSFLVSYLALLFTGPGKFSLDWLIKK